MKLQETGMDTCEVCSKFAPLTRGDNKHYCFQHDPISPQELRKMWGITPNMETPKDKRPTKA